MTARNQDQRAGDHSTNIQSGGPVTVIHHGLTVENAKQLALDLMRPELERLTERAAAVLAERAEEMVVRRLLPKMAQLNPSGIETFEDPDVQYALISAQKTYARTGDSDVADVLVDILVDRTKETERNVRQLALNESLEVAAKLTGDQFAALSLIWLLRDTKSSEIASIPTLAKYVEDYLAPHVDLVRESTATYQHLEFAGCGSIIRLGHRRLSQIFADRYPGLFCRGVPSESLTEAFGDPLPQHILKVVGPSLHDPALYQFLVMEEELLQTEGRSAGWSEEEIEKAREIFKDRLMDADEAGAVMRKAHPAMDRLLNLWEETLFGKLALTTVGITIAHANCRRVMGESPADLSIWIN